MLTEVDTDDHYQPSLRLVEIDKKGSQCGFHLTRSKFDPYPWVSSVDKDSAASLGGLKVGDCVLEVNGTDIVGKRISEIAEIVKSNSEQVSLLLWNAGIHTLCTPENLCCGPLPDNLQRLASCVSSIVAFLECPVCLETAASPTYQCDNGHLICIQCRSKTERCPVCRIRLHRGRSLLADHVLNTLADAFASTEDSEDLRYAKLHKIFKHKHKKNIPDIKITESYPRKVLSKVTGKCSSADNLTSSKYLSPDKELKVKSLSANEMFTPRSPVLSRSSGNSLKIERPASYHGSFESLEKKIEVISRYSSFTSTEGVNYDAEVSYYCPFSNNCLILLKESGVFEHFLKEHSVSKPLIQYFTPKVNIYLRDLKDNQEFCYAIIVFGNKFFLKINLSAQNIESSSDILLWVWCLGSKNTSAKYEAEVQIKSASTKETLLSLRSLVFSLNSISSQEIQKIKKGIYLNSKTIEVLGHAASELLLEINICEQDT